MSDNSGTASSNVRTSRFVTRHSRLVMAMVAGTLLFPPFAMQASASPEEDQSPSIIETTNSNCPQVDLTSERPADTVEYSGAVYKNFTSDVFAGVEVELAEYGSWTGTSYTKVTCVTTDATGRYRLFVPNTWDSSQLVAGLFPPADSFFTSPFDQSSIEFEPLTLDFNAAEAVQNFSLGAAACPSGFGVGTPGESSPFDTVTFSGTVASNESGAPKMVVISNNFFGSICAAVVDGTFSVEVPSYWGSAVDGSGERWGNSGGVLLVAKPFGTEGNSEGNSGGYVFFNGSSAVSNLAYTLGPVGFTATLSVNGGIDGTLFVCISEGEQAPETKYSIGERCDMVLSEPGATEATASLTLEDSSGTDLVPTYWQYIFVGGCGGLWSEWIPIEDQDGTAGAPFVVSGTAECPTGDTGGGGVGGGYPGDCGSQTTNRITGTVQVDGEGYPTVVSLFTGWEGTIADYADKWATDFSWSFVATQADGSFALCFDPSSWGVSGPAIGQIIASSNAPGAEATLGDSASNPFPMSDVIGVSYNVGTIAMQPPVVKGVVTDAKLMSVVELTQNGTRRLASSLTKQETGEFALAFPIPNEGTYLIRADGGSPDEPLVPYQTLYTAGMGPITGALPTPNLIGAITRPDGTAFGEQDHFHFTVEPMGNQSPASVGQYGRKMATLLSDGDWRITATCYNNCGFPQTSGVVSVVDGSIDPSSLPDGWTLTGTTLTFPVSEGSVRFTALDGTENVSSSVEARVQSFNSESGWFDWVDSQPSYNATSGNFAWSPADGDYKVSLIPTVADSDLSETDVYVRVSEGQITSLCELSNVDGRNSLSCEADPTTDPDGVVQFNVLLANFSAQLCGPTANDSECPNPVNPSNSWARAGVEVARIVVEGNNLRSEWVKRIEVPSNRVKLRLEPAGGEIFRLTFMPPWGNPGLWASIERLLFLDSNGDWWSCDTPADPASCVADGGRTPLLDSVDGGVFDYERLEFAVASTVGLVTTPSGQPVRDTWVEIQSAFTDEFENTFYQWVGGAQTNSDGKFGFELPAGNHRVRANPPWENPQGYADGSADFTVTEDEGSRVVSSVTNGGTLVNGEIVVALRNPNVVGTVRAGAQGPTRSYTGISVETEVIDGQRTYWQWVPLWGNTNGSGLFRMFLPDGKWRLTAWPQGADAGQFIEGRIVVTIESGVLTSIGESTCGIGDGEIDCSAFDLVYGTPNASGIVRDSSGDPLSYVGISFETWNDQENSYEWAGWTNTSMSGRYATSLTDGLHRLAVNPSRNSTTVVRTTRYLLVSGESICQFVSESTAKSAQSGLGCATDGASSDLDITMDGPNVVGKVQNAQGVGRASWVRAEIWNGQYFQWQDAWAEANSQGTFRFSLSTSSVVSEVEAVHRLTAEPRSGSGLSAGVTYIKVTSAGWTLWCVDEYNQPAESCPIVDPAPQEIPVVLPGANLIGQAKDGDGNNITRGWVEVFRLDASGNQYWQNSSGLDATGKFSLRLEANGSEGWSRYQVTVNPDPWSNPNNLSKKRLNVWVGDSDDADTVKDEICLDGTGFVDSQTVSSCEIDGLPAWLLADSNDPYQFTLSTGNVSGTIVRPGCEEDCGVSQAELSVEKWVVTDGTNGYWQWANNWARSSSTGAFALQIDDAGDYRVTARPPWGTSDYSPSVFEFNVADPNAPQSVGPVALAVPNVQITITDGTNPVENAWVGVERKVEQNGWTWWEWLGIGTNTTSSGKVSLNVPNTSGVEKEFRLVVYPPWNNPANLSRFTQLIKVADDGTATLWDGNTTTSLAANHGTELPFPAANVVFTVRDPQGSSVRDAWVNVEIWNGSFWEWADISGGSSSSGKVALTVETNGDYRLVVHSPWNRPELPRFVRTFTKSDNGITVDSESVASPWTLSFPTANVSGTVYVTDPTTPDSRRNGYSWIDVRSANGLQHVTGSNTDVSGDFSMYLDDGSYSVWFFGNSSRTSAPPTRVLLTVVNGLVTSWSYDESPETNQCPTSGVCEIEPVLERQPPNLNLVIKIEGSGSVQAGAFVRISGTSTYNFVSKQDGSVQVYLPPGDYEVDVIHVDESGETDVIYTGTGSLTPESFGAPAIEMTLSPVGTP